MAELQIFTEEAKNKVPPFWKRNLKESSYGYGVDYSHNFSNQKFLSFARRCCLLLTPTCKGINHKRHPVYHSTMISSALLH
jgi:hypothetical protein